MYTPVCSAQSRNLRNLRIPKLRANLEIAQPILRLRKRLRNIHLRNLEIARAQFANVMANGVRASELTTRRELRTFRDGDALNGGTPLVWDLSAPVPQTEGKGVSPSWRTSQKPLALVRGLEYTLKVTTELQELITYVSYLYIRWKLEGFNCARNRNCAISRLYTSAARSRDCALVPHNLEIA